MGPCQSLSYLDFIPKVVEHHWGVVTGDDMIGFCFGKYSAG